MNFFKIITYSIYLAFFLLAIVSIGSSLDDNQLQSIVQELKEDPTATIKNGGLFGFALTNLTPGYQITLFGKTRFIPGIDASDFLITIIFIILTYLLFKHIPYFRKNKVSSILLFILLFIIIIIFWKLAWYYTYYSAGQNLGLSSEQLENGLITVQDLKGEKSTNLIYLLLIQFIGIIQIIGKQFNIPGIQ
ncbi:MAG TPA: hypothetical protein VJN02_12990 [Gammaproteobacteria bacterium]|nr:hypothetical protein [Gammaproteobacteria bacterium]